MKIKRYYIYLMTNKTNNVIYTGVTYDLVKRVTKHKNKLTESFTQKYNIDKLVYFEIFDNLEDAIAREKQIKAGPRRKKIDLIAKDNPMFNDLFLKII